MKDEALHTSDTLNKVLDELVKARATRGPHPSLHHAYAALLEQVDELWSEIKKRDQDPECIHKEAIKVVAMATRIWTDFPKDLDSEV